MILYRNEDKRVLQCMHVCMYAGSIILLVTMSVHVVYDSQSVYALHVSLGDGIQSTFL